MQEAQQALVSVIMQKRSYFLHPRAEFCKLHVTACKQGSEML